MRFARSANCRNQAITRFDRWSMSDMGIFQLLRVFQPSRTQRFVHLLGAPVAAAQSQINLTSNFDSFAFR